MHNEKRTVAIIGTGPAGLVTSRWLREVGFGTAFIEEDIEVGGQWRVRRTRQHAV